MKTLHSQPNRWFMDRAEPGAVGFSASRLQVMAQVVDRAVESGQVAGAVVAIARCGRLVHASSHGWQNWETRVPMAEDSIFRVYSMTKVITTVCLLQLYEQGRVGLEEEVRSLLPCFDQLRIHTDIEGKSGPLVRPERPPTVYDLLRHMAGLDYVPMWPLEAAGDALTLQELMELIARRPMVSQPGKRWIYSAATDVIGRIVEVISGLELGDYMRQFVFEPLGMTDTAFRVPEEKRSRLCTLYGEAEENPQELVPIDGSTRDSLQYARRHLGSGGGGLVSTAPDLLRFNQALLNKGVLGTAQVLSRKTVELMCADHLPAGHPSIEFTGKKLRFGLGVSVVRDLGESACIGSPGEFGWGGAAGTMEWIDPAEEMVALLMIQSLSPLSKVLEHRFKATLYAALGPVPDLVRIL